MRRLVARVISNSDRQVAREFVLELVGADRVDTLGVLGPGKPWAGGLTERQVVDNQGGLGNGAFLVVVTIINIVCPRLSYDRDTGRALGDLELCLQAARTSADTRADHLPISVDQEQLYLSSLVIIVSVFVDRVGTDLDHRPGGRVGDVNGHRLAVDGIRIPCPVTEHLVRGTEDDLRVVDHRRDRYIAPGLDRHNHLGDNLSIIRPVDGPIVEVRDRLPVVRVDQVLVLGQLEPRVHVLATDSVARRNGRRPGRYNLHRRGLYRDQRLAGHTGVIREAPQHWPARAIAPILDRVVDGRELGPCLRERVAVSRVGGVDLPPRRVGRNLVVHPAVIPGSLHRDHVTVAVEQDRDHVL